jgi:hypothetical protein
MADRKHCDGSSKRRSTSKSRSTSSSTTKSMGRRPGKATAATVDEIDSPYETSDDEFVVPDSDSDFEHYVRDYKVQARERETELRTINPSGNFQFGRADFKALTKFRPKNWSKISAQYALTDFECREQLETQAG